MYYHNPHIPNPFMCYIQYRGVDLNAILCYTTKKGGWTMKNFTKTGSDIGAFIGAIIHPKAGRIAGKLIGGSIGAYIDYLTGHPEAIAEGMAESAKNICDYGFDPNDFL